MAAAQQEKPPVRLTIRKTTSRDTQNIVSTNAGVQDALDDLGEYAGRGNADNPITRCGGRIFRTPVFRIGHNQLAKANIKEQESRIVKALTSWIGTRTNEWSVWISQHIFADLNLAVEEDVIDYNSIQVFFIGENLPAFVLVLYGVTELSESSPTEQDEETAALEFSVELARDLTAELHKYCCVDFLLLPCALPYTKFIQDVQTLQNNIESEQKESEWYYTGSQQIDTAGYKEVKEAASLVAGVSYVPYILESIQTENEDKIWLLELNPRWRRALSLLTEVLGSTEDATYTLTCSEDKYRTVEMTVLEAARRWAFSHAVILRVPAHSDLDLDKREHDLLHLTGKRKHTRNRIHIKTTDSSDVPALECGRYRGESEAEHLQKKAEVPTSQGGHDVRGIFLSKEESVPPEGNTGQELLQKSPGGNTYQLQNDPREMGSLRRRHIKCSICTRFVGCPKEYTFFSDIDIEDLVQKGSTNPTYMFKKLFCALLNRQQATCVIFHVPDCRLGNMYDSKVDDMLMSLVPDGSAFQDTFEKQDIDAQHFWVLVKPSRDTKSCILSTLNFHTCFSLDKGIDRKPTHLQMQTFLKKPKHDSDTDQILPKDDDFIVDQEVLIDGTIPFTSNVYRQAKRSGHKQSGKMPQIGKEKLGEYISALSKVSGGGTVYFGVGKITETKQFELTRFICKGVYLDEQQKESFKHICHEKMEEMLWVAHNQTKSTPGIEVDFIRPKNAPKGCCVIKVTVKQFKGVGFLRRDGPESYILDENNNPTEVKSWAEWARLSNCKDLVVVSAD